MKSFRTLIAAGAALLASASVALAAGYFTPNLSAVAAADIQSTFQVPVDTEYSGGATPQSAYVTTGALKTYAQGGAIVTATGTSNASTANGERVIITTEALTTAAGATFTETITDSSVAAASLATCSVALGSATTGMPVVTTTTPGAGSLVVIIQNIHASAALNGTIKIGCRISS
jgi:hypothetical protein